MPLFTEVRGRVILRTSRLRRSQKFASGFLGEYDAIVAWVRARGNAWESRREGRRALGLAKVPKRLPVLLLLALSMLFCLGILLSLLTTATAGMSSELARSDAGHSDGGVLGPLAEFESYLLTPADDAQEQDKRLVNASVLTMLVLVITSLFGASNLCLLMRNPRRREAIRPCRGAEEGRRWLVGTHDGPSFLGVFLL
jgi:hypothetical protein